MQETKENIIRVYNVSTVIYLFEKGLISKEKSLQMLDLYSKRSYLDVSDYISLYLKNIVDKDDILSYIKCVNITDRGYIELYEASILTKEELFKALGI
jgi:DNA-binding phage protein